MTSHHAESNVKILDESKLIFVVRAVGRAISSLSVDKIIIIILKVH